jgi:histidine triad (HIT) family protein
MEDCIFCKIARKEISAEIVYEDDSVLAFKDIHPAAPVHFLIIPKRHIPTVLDIREEDKGLAGHIQFVAAGIARELGLAEKGFRIVVNCLKDAGQDVFHIHYHFLAGQLLKWPLG